ncbi:histone-lysine N-methyltransferase ATX5 isoform X2 [Spinacia oleracea]|uniref:Histone-lysine N-methyltransferase ATX5 isoform X2 n=1 Tax=Spinacia oleracea TaxID=3562 RepID=A0ABM3R6I4_SPIOL|nr:histone-lysine N-methyltransferase ATX5-like isoform X2 [Spinacia oleracea]XP_056691235.1 histone-lysine N-methyltransferase ATX5-like isoform X2 [Spinacia oleracea]XP_056691236.1 histone-lysine N-methyltransferase ATX5-like isoform X2 [Spinacia oleracea]XP_056691237.1 histone-lysine N-methyltransferase ATX5-like isoform X2 [Spinacia oleracea]
MTKLSTFFVMLQMVEFHAQAATSAKPPEKSLKIRKQKLLSFLQEQYESVYAKWTTERCVVCRWVEDWDYNKIIICNSCIFTCRCVPFLISYLEYNYFHECPRNY